MFRTIVKICVKKKFSRAADDLYCGTLYMACGNIGQYVDQVLTFCVLCICYFIEQMYRRVASALLPGLYSNFYGFQWWIHEFPGGCLPQRRGDDLLFGIFFAENCTKIKKNIEKCKNYTC